ncbi:MAG: type III pantothenate kinase [Dehalococcoidales bacterium]|jgi:type III pantothenate kinase|nr:type III pantothenate kinase [Dehalococcoidales bacterium]
MLLAIDVGNTGMGLGIFEGDKLRISWRMATSISRMPDEYAGMLLSLLHNENLQPRDITDVCLCSVVPPMVGTLEDMFQRYFKIKPLVVGTGTKTGVKIRMDNPREVGPDRIVHSAAAYHLYGGPLIIVDMGTATTFDTVSKNGEYTGGAIAPGIQTGAEALFARTAMLPRVNLARPAKAIGTNTIAAMQSGIVFGYVSLIEGMVARIQKELPEKARVILTGGFTDLVSRCTNIIDEVNPNLIFIGLKLIYEMNRS